MLNVICWNKIRRWTFIEVFDQAPEEFFFGIYPKLKTRVEVFERYDSSYLAFSQVFTISNAGFALFEITWHREFSQTFFT